MRSYLLASTALLGLGAFLLPAAAQQFKPGGDGIPIVCAYNASPPTVLTGNFVYAQCSNNGTLLGSGGGGGGGGTSSNFGAAFPSAGTAAGFKDFNGNMGPANLDASGNVLVDVATGSFTFTWPGNAGNSTPAAAVATGTMPYVNAYIHSTSGAIVSGTFASGAFASGSFVSGALADGAITTLGTEADTAWTSGSGTEIAILKKIAGNTGTLFNGAVTMASGAVAAGAFSAGSVVSGALLSGALADGAITTMGTEADAAWSSGSGTAIAILKKIAGNTAAGGGAVTLASGAVASGAYSAGAFASGSYPSGALSDGAITTIGTEADAAWSSGSGTVIAVLKKIAGSTAIFNGAVTQAASSVAAGAYSAGAFVSGSLVDGAITTLGTEADAAWTSGSGTVISLLKAIVAEFGTATPTTFGTGTPSGTVPAVNAAIIGANTNVQSNAVGQGSPVVQLLQSTGGYNAATYAISTNQTVQANTHTVQLMMLDCYNPNATVAYIQAWNTSLSGTELISVGVPATSHAGFTLSTVGIQFTAGLFLQAATTQTGSTGPSTALACNVAYTFT